MARIEYDYDSNGLARVSEDTQWFLLDRNGNQVGERYTYIEEWGEGFYNVDNIMVLPFGLSPGQDYFVTSSLWSSTR